MQSKMEGDASQVRPFLLDKEMVTTFLSALKKPYNYNGDRYNYMMGHVTLSFHEIILIGKALKRNYVSKIN